MRGYPIERFKATANTATRYDTGKRRCLACSRAGSLAYYYRQKEMA